MACITQKKLKKIFSKNLEIQKQTLDHPKAKIALFTYRIHHLSNHLKSNRKDFNTERSLVRLVGKRRSLLDYLKSKDIERYRNIVKELGLRK